MLSLNILDHSFVELLQPLDRNQVAPIGFLFIEKCVVTILGDSDWCLRLLPYLSYLLSIVLIYKLNRLLFKSSKIALLASAIFSLNFLVLNYSIEVKQYSTDIFTSLLLIISFLNYLKQSNRKSLFYYSVIAILSIWLSNISIIILFSIGLFTLYSFYKNKKQEVLKASLPLMLGLGSFCIYYVLFINNHPTKAMMVDYWGKAGAFLPYDVFSLDFYQSLFLKVELLFKTVLVSKRLWLISLLFVLIAIITSLKKDKIILVLLLPILVHLGLSYFKLYPFDVRLVLYLVPLLISLISAGIIFTYDYLTVKNIKIGVLLVLFPLVTSLYIAYKKVPVQIEEIKESMAYMNTHINPKDTIYVYYSSEPAFLFYKKNYPQIDALNSIIWGNGIRGRDKSVKEVELSRLSGDFWMLFSHLDQKGPYDVSPEEAYFIKNLKTKGYRIEHQKTNYGSTVYKFVK
ncbi:glycosyltransferase family 39 protein [Winogradskyella wandonensis]|nr:glycosyltransferase family 39 protein [Winogradskyella wandonensis]